MIAGMACSFFRDWQRVARLGCGAAALLACAAGCKVKPPNDMDNQPRYRAYQPSDFFADGTSARPIPAGAIPVDSQFVPGLPYAAERDSLPADTTVASEAQAIPFPVTRDVIERGQERFNIYCSACHGRLGNGGGMIAQRGLTPPPSFHIERLRNVSDAHYYNVITNGYGAMFSYGDRVRPEDRWMIVAYVRALQAASQNAQASLTPEEQRKLQGIRP